MILSTRPLKFECTHCQTTYYHPYATDWHDTYCPSCHQSGLLLGTAEIIDLLKHPISITSLILKYQQHKIKAFKNIS